MSTAATRRDLHGINHLVDCQFDHCDLANLSAERCSLQRVRLSGARLTGVAWLDGGLRDFEDCDLTGADFQYAQLDGAQFVDCDLTGAQFSKASMVGTRLHHCELAGVGGIASFQGAVVTAYDPVALCHTLAGGLGIQLDHPNDPADPE